MRAAFFLERRAERLRCTDEGTDPPCIQAASCMQAGCSVDVRLTVFTLNEQNFSGDDSHGIHLFIPIRIQDIQDTSRIAHVFEVDTVPLVTAVVSFDSKAIDPAVLS